MDTEFEGSPEKLNQINEVIQKILTTGIPESPEKIKVMILILDNCSCIQDRRLQATVKRLQQNLIEIYRIYESK